METLVKPTLPPMPPRIAALPIHPVNGYPIPWFVGTDSDGSRDFRFADPRKLALAVKHRLCWVCGDAMGQYMCFVLGPMCVINMNSAEPPSHKECAIFSAMACPFLTRPNMVRRENDLPEEIRGGETTYPMDGTVAGVGLKRNPGAVALWTCKTYITRVQPEGGVLFTPGRLENILWYSEGRIAKRAEVMASVESGLPILLKLAEEEGPEACLELGKMVGVAMKYFPGEGE
jgi:hypothetical protein